MTRHPRPARPVPITHRQLSDTLVGLSVASVIVFLVVVFYHRYLYFAAGVRYVDMLGSIAAVVAFLAVLAAAALTYRAGHAGHAVAGVAGVAVALAVGFAVLPPVVAGLGWVAIVLSVVLSVVAYAVLASWVVGAAVYLPLPWESGEDGTRTREGTDPNPISSRAP